MKTIVFLLTVLTVHTAIVQAESIRRDEPTAEISRLREGLAESFRKGDVDKLLTYVDPDVVVTWQNAEVCRGREGVRAFYDRMMNGDKRIVREIKSDPVVLGRHVSDDWAVSWGNLNDHFVLMDGADLPFNSVFTATISKKGDQWFVTAFHVSVNAFDNPVLKTALRKTTTYVALAAGSAGLVVGLALGVLLRRQKRTR